MCTHNNRTDLRYELDNFNDTKVRKLVIIQTEKSRKKHLENSLYKINDEILRTNWINKINPKKQYYNREIKERKKERKEANIKDMRDMTLRELLPKLNIKFVM